jgi:CRP-like cAMP-binding protein
MEKESSMDASSFVADPKLIQKLETWARPVVLGPDGILFRQGDAPAGVYIILQGHVTLTMLSAAEPTLNAKTGAGSLLGLPAVIGEEPYSLTAKASEDAIIHFVTSADFIDLMRREPMFSFHVLRVLAQEIRAAREAFSTFVDASH